MPKLFEPLTIRSVTLRNRIVLSSMCQYSAIDGIANDWHLVHLGSRAVGGAGLILTEDTAVLQEGRITTGDLGIWMDTQIEPLARIARFVHGQGAAFGIQLGYAGRKGSTTLPWQGGHPQGEGRALTEQEGAWTTFAPSPLPFGGNRSQTPDEMSLVDIGRVQDGFVEAARRADAVGADVIEFHAGWGYIFHQFYSPITNHRLDEYGGSFENRIRFMTETVKAVRKVWPTGKGLFARIALSDWLEEGWKIEDAISLARVLLDAGVDLIDGTSGAIRHDSIPSSPSPLMHVPLVQRLRREAGIMTGANYGIDTPEQAENIVGSGSADVVVIGRAMLRDPYWAQHAAHDLGYEQLLYPDQYEHWLSGRTAASKSDPPTQARVTSTNDFS